MEIGETSNMTFSIRMRLLCRGVYILWKQYTAASILVQQDEYTLIV